MKPDDWEQVSCPLCPHLTDHHVRLKCGDRFQQSDHESFLLEECANCGLIFLNPRPSQSAVKSAHNADGYDPFLSIQGKKTFIDRIYDLARTFTLKWKHRLVSQLVSPPDVILDGGCGTGEFLNELNRHQYQVIGFEPDPLAARWARERFGLAVHTGYLDSFERDPASVDLVTLWHVLEHMSNPLPALTQIHKLLSKKGQLLIAVPNIGSLDARIYGQYWVPLDAPRHLWHFRKTPLEQLAQQAGFRVTRTGMLPLDVFYNVLLSELFFTRSSSKIQFLLMPFRMFLSISGSLIYGLMTGNHSSCYYVLEKSDED